MICKIARIANRRLEAAINCSVILLNIKNFIFKDEKYRFGFTLKDFNKKYIY